MSYACESNVDLDSITQKSVQEPISTKSGGFGLSASMGTYLSVQWDNPFYDEPVVKITARNMGTGANASQQVSPDFRSCSFYNLSGYGTYQIIASCRCGRHEEQITYVYNEKGFNPTLNAKVCNHEYEYKWCASLTQQSAHQPTMRLVGNEVSFRFWIAGPMIVGIHQLNNKYPPTPPAEPTQLYGGISSAPGTYTETPFFRLPPLNPNYIVNGLPEYEIRLYAYTNCFAHPQYPSFSGSPCTHYYRARIKLSDYPEDGYYKPIYFQEVKN